MIKLLLRAAPYVLKMPSSKSQKREPRSLMAAILFGFGALALTASAFIYVSDVYGAAAGFLTVSAILFSAGLAFLYRAKRKPALKTEAIIADTSSDPIASMLPDAVLKDPSVSKALMQISKNPIAASVAAAAIGMLVTREFMGD